ncbi:MAG: hypothetical protein WAN92_04800 [Herbaspirillum sp.]
MSVLLGQRRRREGGQGAGLRRLAVLRGGHETRDWWNYKDYLE